MFSYFSNKVTPTVSPKVTPNVSPSLNPIDVNFNVIPNVNNLSKENEQLKKQIEELQEHNKELMKKMDHYRQEAMIYKDLIYKNK